MPSLFAGPTATLNVAETTCSAGAVVEKVSSMAYVDYVRERVFVPAGMDQIGADDTYAIIPHRARGYRLQNGVLQNCHLADTSNKVPGGGMAGSRR